MKKGSTVRPAFAFFWRWHEPEGTYWRRIWTSYFIGDQFEVVNEEQFNKVRDVCKQFGIPFVRSEEDR